jgi:hypothetical protein
MKSSTSRVTQSPKSGRFVLTRAKGEKISAVEGMKLTERMERILDRNATGDERRSLIKEQVRRK